MRADVCGARGGTRRPAPGAPLVGPGRPRALPRRALAAGRRRAGVEHRLVPVRLVRLAAGARRAARAPGPLVARRPAPPRAAGDDALVDPVLVPLRGLQPPPTELVLRFRAARRPRAAAGLAARLRSLLSRLPD